MIALLAQHWLSFTLGFVLSVAVSFIVIVLSVLVGSLLALAKTSSIRPLRSLAWCYTALFRGIPPLLMLYLVYFGLPSWALSSGAPALVALTEPLNNRLFAAVFALTLISSAYSTEIIRAAIDSVPKEQWSAARSIGMPYWLTMRRVIAPQAVRFSIPPLGNEYIAVLKATSLVSVIGVAELMRATQLVASMTFRHMEAYTIAAIYYVSFVITLEIGLRLIGRSGRTAQAAVSGQWRFA
ncbi:amino acid ABC transporter permease [Pseudochelatococcus sp. B33]